MAIAIPTVLDTVTSTVTGTTIASNSVSPAANALLAVVAGAGIGSSTTPAPASIGDTLSGGSLTWTKYEEEHSSASLAESLAIFTAQTGATPGSGVITTTWNSSANRHVQLVCQSASGFNTTTPVAQSAIGNGIASTLTLTLAGTPAADSMVLAAIVSRQTPAPNVGAGTGFTELTEALAGTNFAMQVMYDNAGADATADWTSTGTQGNAGVAIEIAAAAVAADGQAARTLIIGGQFGVTMLPTGGAGMVVIN